MAITIPIITILPHPVHANMRERQPWMLVEFERMIGIAFLLGENFTWSLHRNTGGFASFYVHTYTPYCPCNRHCI